MKVTTTATYFLLLFSTLLAVGGCNRTSSAKAASRANNLSAQWSDDLFNFAIANLNHLEDNDCQEMLRSTKDRLQALQRPDLFPGVTPPNSLLASWPEPDMLRQVVARLNAWVDTLDKPKPWTPDPMLATLPGDLSRLPMLADLGQPHFTAYDGYMLMEAVWARDVTRWAKGNTSDDLLVARNLFDWTIRNIQLDYDGPDHVPQVPWETLFLGHGTALERAWIYILLLRQCDIDAAVLALPEKEAAGGKADAAELKPWCVAVLLGDKEKKLYLFEPRLGLPIPAPHGITVGKSGQLEVQPATFDQIVADPALLDRLSASGDAPYWAKKSDLKHAVALVEASPLYIEPRAKRVEATLAGERKMVLSAEPSEQAARFKAAGLGDARLWDLPYRTLQRRMSMLPDAVAARLFGFLRFIGFGQGVLYKGRILQLKGRFFDEKGAIAYYQKARPRTRDVMADESKRAEAYYKFILAETAKTKKITPELDENMKQYAVQQIGNEFKAILMGKIDAAYWLGLIEYEQGEYESALDYFIERTLKSGSVVWASGANYNVGRSQEMLGKWQKAVEEYESSIFLRNEAGSLLRAKWLKELHGATNAAEGKKPEKKPEKKMEEKKIDEKKVDGKKVDEKKATEKKP